MLEEPGALWVGAPSKAPLAVALAGTWYLEGEADPARVRRRQRRSQLLWDVIQAERRGACPASAQSLRPGLSGLCGSGRLLLSCPWAREPDPLAFCVDAMCLPPRSGHSRRPRSVLDAGQTLRVFAAPRNQASGPGSREERCQPAVICEEEIGFADIVKIPLSGHMLGSLLKPAPSSAPAWPEEPSLLF